MPKNESLVPARNMPTVALIVIMQQMFAKMDARIERLEEHVLKNK